MPELPEMEAWRRALNDPVSAFPIVKAGPAHVATLKTFDPPLSTLEGRRLAGVERRAKRLLFPTEDGELVVLVHLMTAGRLKFLQFGERGPKTPAFRLVFEGGSQLVLTEAGANKRAGVWLLTPEEAERELAHLGPEALGIGTDRLGEICAAESRRLRPSLGERDPAPRETLTVRADARRYTRAGRAARGRDRRRAATWPRAARARHQR
ncbi:MAG: hypothetical protein E6G36_14045 [Actinobacteria bacterium]|nr:MAG: hypothetical protein E6G36_14045 [Actinomycetota bacterium]